MSGITGINSQKYESYRIASPAVCNQRLTRSASDNPNDRERLAAGLLASSGAGADGERLQAHRRMCSNECW
jgi:hypothetical protein